MDNRRTFLLPKTSESEAAGKLINMPGMVEAAAIIPVRSLGVPRLMAKGFNTGFLDMVELKMAKAPIMHRTQKYRLVALAIFPSCIGNQLITFWKCGILAFAFKPLDENAIKFQFFMLLQLNGIVNT